MRIQRFKRITDAAIDLGAVNVFVGGNNAGKSSLIQGLHFGVGLLQTIALSGVWKASTSLSPTQLIYSPAEDIHALGIGGKLFEDADKAISLDFNLISGESCGVDIRKGRNRNVLVAIKNKTVAERLSSLERPFSVFSPGLAGISKRENYVSDGVLLRTLARGDANLILRNILLRLKKSQAWDGFLSDLQEVFPKIAIQVKFEEKTAEFIEVFITPENDTVPLELAGTGVLQAVQILSYIHRFSPSMMVLDEPDSHLHPNNQRLMCSLLRRVAEERGTQILLTTHSRHVVDALMGAGKFLWVRNGSVDVAGVDDEIGILLDIGALDIKERAGQPSAKAIVLTEDELVRPLELILTSSGFDLATTVVLPYFGVTGIKQLRPLVKMIRGTNASAKIILHRDRDFLKDPEVEEWKIQVRELGVEPFVTPGRDIEALFINEDYIGEYNPELNDQQISEVIEHVIAASKNQLIRDYVNGRVEIERRSGRAGSLDHGKLAVEASTAVAANQRKYAGKAVMKAIRAEVQKRYKMNLAGGHSKSDNLSDTNLAMMATKIPKTKVK